MPELRLKIYRSPSESRDETYRQPRVTIGREINNDIVIAEKEVSRFHCAFEWGEGGWQVVDLESTNGTYLNGIAVRKSAVKSGDVVVAGSTRLHVLECTATLPFDQVAVGDYRVVQTFDARGLVEGKKPASGVGLPPPPPPTGPRGETTPMPAFPPVLAPALTAVEIFQGARDSHALAQTIARRLSPLVRADVCLIYLSGRETSALERAAAEPAEDDSLVPGEILEHVQREKSAVYVQLHEPLEAAGATPGARAVMCAPMLDGPRLLGVIALVRRSSVWNFGDSDFVTLSVSALAAGAIVSYARSYARLETAYLDLLDATDSLPAGMGERRQDEAGMILLEATAQQLGGLLSTIAGQCRLPAAQPGREDAAEKAFAEIDAAARQSLEIVGRIERLARQGYEARGETALDGLLGQLAPVLDELAGPDAGIETRMGSGLPKVAVAPRVVWAALVRVVLFCRDRMGVRRMTLGADVCALDTPLRVEGYGDIAAGAYVRVRLAAEGQPDAVDELRGLREDESDAPRDLRSRLVGLYWAARTLRRAAGRLVVQPADNDVVAFELYLPVLT